MNKVLGVALGLIILTSCTNGGFGTGFDVAAGISGTNVNVEITYVEGTDGNPKVNETHYTLTQPTVTFITQAGSLGATVESADITIMDGSGNIYADVAGKYTQSFAVNIPSGWSCSATTTTEAVGCANPVPVRKVTTAGIPTMQLISAQVAEKVAADCGSAFGCVKNLRADIIFKAIDTNGARHNIVSKNVPITVYAQYTTKEG